MFYTMGIFGWFFGGWIGAIGTNGSFSYKWAIGAAILAGLMGLGMAEEEKEKEETQTLINAALKTYIDNNKS